MKIKLSLVAILVVVISDLVVAGQAIQFEILVDRQAVFSASTLDSCRQNHWLLHEQDLTELAQQRIVGRNLVCRYPADQLVGLQEDTDEATAQLDTAEKEAQLFSGFGGHTRKVTCSEPAVQKWFDQGIQLLYGFNHDEAIRSFSAAAKLDPSCAMAWWGIAYAHGLHINNPEMSQQQSRLAYDALQKALAALDDETAVERALVQALASRYQWPAPEDRKPLDQAYADAMEKVWHQFPDDSDVATLFAESLMNLQPWDLWTHSGKPKGRTIEILAVLERTLRHFPNHPGANHLYIHAIEASPWPELGVPAAERLQDLVPGSGHLVHMPSHIFIRVGRYADAAESNVRAIAADEAYFAKAPPPDFYSLYYIHNVHFLAYASMMEGRFNTALEAARKIEKQIPPNFLKDYVEMADGFMPTSLHVLIRFGRWEEILAEPEPEDWRLLSRGFRHYARAVALANLRRFDEASKELASLDQARQAITEDWKVGNNSAIEVLRIARLMAEGELQFHSGQRDAGFELLERAIEFEDQLVYDEPPGWMQPVRHALGALLMADRRFARAEAVYRADLSRHPNNPWSLLGLQQSLERQGKDAESEAMSEEVNQAWARADVKPIASCYCYQEFGN
jgi:tetratricopeptide (TPR) repeat protein